MRPCSGRARAAQAGRLAMRYVWTDRWAGRWAAATGAEEAGVRERLTSVKPADEAKRRAVFGSRARRLRHDGGASGSKRRGGGAGAAPAPDAWRRRTAAGVRRRFRASLAQTRQSGASARVRPRVRIGGSTRRGQGASTRRCRSVRNLAVALALARSPACGSPAGFGARHCAPVPSFPRALRGPSWARPRPPSAGPGARRRLASPRPAADLGRAFPRLCARARARLPPRRPRVEAGLPGASFQPIAPRAPLRVDCPALA